MFEADDDIDNLARTRQEENDCFIVPYVSLCLQWKGGRENCTAEMEQSGVLQLALILWDLSIGGGGGS